MVEHLIGLQSVLMKMRLTHALVLMLTLVAGVAQAEVLQDPTQPYGEAQQAGAPAAYAGPVLQSVMLSSGRKIAVISGEMVPLGGKYQDATLVRLNDWEAVLRAEDGTLQTLRMHPGVEKTLRKPALAKPGAKTNARNTR